MHFQMHMRPDRCCVFTWDSCHGLHTTGCWVVNIEQDQTKIVTLSVIVRRRESDRLSSSVEFSTFIRCLHWVSACTSIDLSHMVQSSAFISPHICAFILCIKLLWCSAGLYGVCTIYLSVCQVFICVLFFFFFPRTKTCASLMWEHSWLQSRYHAS